MLCVETRLDLKNKYLIIKMLTLLWIQPLILKHNLMKTKYTFILFMLLSMITYAQNGINYKAVIKDNLGNVVANDLIAIQFSILQGASQTNVYEETHTPTTDSNGIIMVNIGEGTAVSGDYSTIDWGSDSHFLNVKVNTGGGLVDMGTTEFKTVPYALTAKSIENPLWIKNGLDVSYMEGGVGIGTSTPENKLHVVGDLFVQSNIGGLILGYPNNGNQWKFATTGGGSDLLFMSKADGLSSQSTRLKLLQNGNVIMAETEGKVGVGISNPANPFSILQTSGVENTVRIESLDHQLGKDLLELQIPSNATSASQFIEMQKGTEIVAAINGDGSANFSKIGVDGNPNGKLHIFQNGQSVGTGLRFDDGINSNWDITHGYSLRFHYGATLKGYILANTGAYTISSDISLKKDIQSMPTTLDRVKQLKPSTYVYKDDITNTKAIGFIAQEVKSLFPELVHFSEADELYGIDYAGFSVVAIKAIQEQQHEIEDLKNQVNELKDLLETLLKKQQ